MFPLFVAFILGTVIVWWLGSPTPRAIFAPHQRRSIVDRRRRREHLRVVDAQERAATRSGYGPLNDAQREELNATLARMKGCDVEQPPVSLPEAA